MLAQVTHGSSAKLSIFYSVCKDMGFCQVQNVERIRSKQVNVNKSVKLCQYTIFSYAEWPYVAAAIFAA